MLTEIQQKLLEMMKEIDAICREQNIHYTLGGGTAIGAIRHGGFIPWDDDIDIYMTRENWEKFKKASENGRLPRNRVLESPETDIEYSNTFARYVSTDTTAIHSHQIISKDAAGHVIDIFVFDPIHIDNFWKFIEDFELYSDLMNETMSFSTRFDMNIDRYEEYYERAKKHGKKIVIDELINSFTHLDSPGWKHYVMEWGTAPFLFPSSIFDYGYIRVPFEDITLEIVKNYAEYLTWQYGDEWQYIPNHEGREGHDAIFSSKLSYEVVRADYLPFIDEEKLHTAYYNRKRRLLIANPHRRKSQKLTLKAAGEKCRDRLINEICRRDLCIQDLKEKLKQKKYGELSEIFYDYYNVQLSTEFIGKKDKHSTLHRYYNPVLIELEDNLFEIAVEFLIRTERMSKAKRLIEIYKGYSGEIKIGEAYGSSEKIKSLEEEIDLSRAIIYTYSMNRNQKLYKIVNAFLERYPDNTQIKRIKIRMILENNNIEEDRVGVASEVLRSLMKVCNKNSIVWGENLKYYQDLERIRRRDLGIYPEDARKYLDIYKITKNGYIRREIEKLFLGCEVELNVEEENSRSVILTRKESDYAKKTSFYRLARDLYRLIAHSDDSTKEMAWNIACRTRDRIELLDYYEDKISSLKRLMDAENWEELSEEMSNHEEAVLRNYKAGLGLCVHPELSEIQNVLFMKNGQKDLVDKIERLVPRQHRNPIGR